MADKQYNSRPPSDDLPPNRWSSSVSSGSLGEWDGWDDSPAIQAYDALITQPGDYHVPNNVLGRLANRVMHAAENIEQRGPHWRRQLTGFVVGSLVHVSLVGAGVAAIVDHFTSHGHEQDGLAQPVPPHLLPPTTEVSVSSPSSTTSTTLEHVSETSLEAEYNHAEVKVQHQPFAYVGETTASIQVQKQQLDDQLANLLVQKSQIALSKGVFSSEYEALEATQTDLQTQLSKLDQSEQDAEFAGQIVDLREKMGAVYQESIQLSSGVKINFYRHGEKDAADPYKIDPQALDVYVNHLFELTTQVDSPRMHDEVERISQLAKSGQLNDLVIDVVMDTSNGECLDEADNFVSRTGAGVVCKALGADIRQGGKTPAHNQLVVMTDGGSYVPQDYYPNYDDLNKTNIWLSPNEGMAVVFAHEVIGHALVGYSNNNDIWQGATNDEKMADEHKEFVNKVEAKAFTYLAAFAGSVNYEAQNTGLKYTSPFTVE